MLVSKGFFLSPYQMKDSNSISFHLTSPDVMCDSSCVLLDAVI